MNEQGGYTLVELIVAIAIFGILVSMVSNFVITYQQSLNSVQNRIIANNLARLKLEKFRSNGLENKNKGRKQFQQEEFLDYSYSIEKIKKRAGLKAIRLRVYYLEDEIFNLVTLI